METKSDQGKFERLRSALQYDFMFCVPCKGKSGGLLILWNAETEMTINSYSEGHIDTNIKGKMGSWRFTGFYGNPETDKRHFSWALLERLKVCFTGPWIVGGDFNEIMSAEEKK